MYNTFTEPEQFKKFMLNSHLMDQYQYFIVLDLDDTLVYTPPIYYPEINQILYGKMDLNDFRQYIKIRPFAEVLIKQANQIGCCLIIWSAGQIHYVKQIWKLLDPNQSLITAAIGYGHWFEISKSKNINLLGLNPSYTLLIENTIYCAKDQLATSIIVPNWCGCRLLDDQICLKIKSIINNLTKSGQSVQDYLATLPDPDLVTRLIGFTNCMQIFCYYYLKWPN